MPALGKTAPLPVTVPVVVIIRSPLPLLVALIPDPKPVIVEVLLSVKVRLPVVAVRSNASPAVVEMLNGAVVVTDRVALFKVCVVVSAPVQLYVPPAPCRQHRL